MIGNNVEGWCEMGNYTLITGASGGIGKELARLSAADGKNLILTARNEEKLYQIKNELESRYQIEAEVVRMDLSEESSAETLYQMCRDQGWSVDVLINNVGFGDHNGYLDTPWERQKNMIDINVIALMHLTHLFGSDMRNRKCGKILNLASLASFCAGPYMSVYYASKAFVRSFSEALHEELSEYGVTVTALCPGPVATDFEKNAHLSNSNMFRVLKVADAASVAEIGYRAMRKGKALAYCGIMTKGANVLSRFVSRRFARKTAMKVNGRKEQRADRI